MSAAAPAPRARDGDLFADDAHDEEARVRAEVDQTLALHLAEVRGTSDLGQVLLAGLSAYVFSDTLPVSVTLGWLGAFVVFAGARALWRRSVVPKIADPRMLLRVIRGDIVLSAGLWALLAMLLVDAPILQLAELTIVFAGMIAAATSTQVSDRVAFFGFMGTLIASLVAAVVMSGLSNDHITLLLLTGLFVPFMTTVQQRAHDVLRSRIASTIRLRISEEETARGRNFLNALVSNAPSPIVVLDSDGSVLRVNPAFERTTGFQWGDAHGRDLPSLLSGEGERKPLQSFLSSIREGARSVSELRLRRKGGSEIWMRISGTQAGREAAGTAILVCEDVTEQVEAREAQELARRQAEEAARAKSAFLASMSHEIRTPMNGILGMLELLMDTPLSDEQRESMRVVRSSADGLLRILNDILDVSKIEAGQLDLEAIDFDLPGLLNETARMFASQAAAHGTELLVDVRPDVPRAAHGDPVRLRQILGNLLSNAVKFTDGGEVLLSARKVGEERGVPRIRFSVRDTGIGIAPDKQQLVFQEFEQADSSTTRVHGGTGLGLSISRRLVEIMGGRLQLESALGTGSDFFFELDIPAAVEGRLGKRKIPAVSLEGRRFLVVDDNSTARRISREALENEGSNVDEASTVDAGLDLLRLAHASGGYDAVILDHLMPNKDGFDFVTAVERLTIEAPPILMLTSSADIAGKQQARELGVGGYLPKPLSRADLVLAVASLLGQEGERTGGERRLITRETLIVRSDTPIKVLLAEDNAVNQQVAVALLRKRGYEVQVVDNGRKALEAAAAEAYDVVLMDIQMPEMDGLEATRRIRAYPGLEQLPIIALTAHAFQEERERTVEAGMNDFLAKPFKPEALYEIVERWVMRDEISDVDPEGAPGDAVAGAQPPVDIEGFRAIMREVGVEEIVEATLDVYLGEAPELFGNIRAAVEGSDLDSVRSAAHSLKSSSGNIRANRLADLLQALEEAGRNGDAEAVGRLYPTVHAEYESVMEYLSRQKAG